MISRTKMKQYGRAAALSMCLTAVASLAVTGCTVQTEEPVIAERTTQAGEAGQDNVWTGTEGSNKSAPGEGLHGDGAVGTDQSAGGDTGGGLPGSKNSSRKTLALQTEAPERYQTQVKGNRVEIGADAAVSVPAVSGAPVLETERGVPYSREDFSQFKEALHSLEGIVWEEDVINEEGSGQYISCRSEDGAYYVNFQDGQNSGSIPMIWLNRQTYSYGSSDGFDSRDISGMSLNTQQQETLEKELSGKADQLLKAMGLEQFRQVSAHWRALSHWDKNGWIPDGRYGLVMEYSQAAGGITETANMAAVWGEDQPRTQYVTIVYADDGELMELKDIDHVNHGGIAQESGFLLPFSAVAEIFEQYVKSYYDTHEPSYDQLADENQSHLINENMKACAYVTVTEVRLEYRAVYEAQDSENLPQKGRLEPVWNFYGDILVGYRNQDGADSGVAKARLRADPNRLLVSISAGDGRVYGR